MNTYLTFVNTVAILYLQLISVPKDVFYNLKLNLILTVSKSISELIPIN